MIKKPIKGVLLDLDEVLADFAGGACRVHGKRLENLEPGEPRDLQVKLGLRSKEAFWKPINSRGISFWEYLEPLPWIEELLIIARALSEEPIRIITTPPSGPGAHLAILGKHRWLVKILGWTDRNRYIFTRDKKIYSLPGYVLIDDSRKNVVRFSEGRGLGILFPAYFNQYYEERNNPLPRVTNALLQIGEHNALHFP